MKYNLESSGDATVTEIFLNEGPRSRGWGGGVSDGAFESGRGARRKAREVVALVRGEENGGIMWWAEVRTKWLVIKFITLDFGVHLTSIVDRTSSRVVLFKATLICCAEWKALVLRK